MAPRTLSTMVIGLALLLVGVSQSTATPPPPKDTICHFEEEEGTWKQISVGGNASEAHIANHDDALPGGMTTQTGTQLDADCKRVMAVEACGNCLTTGHGPSCENSDCETAVCAFDTFCCDTDSDWDVVCVGEAQTICVAGGLCTGEACGNCSTVRDAPGCEFPGCEGAVCEIDPDCCSSDPDLGWDVKCVGEAQLICVGTSLCLH